MAHDLDVGVGRSAAGNQHGQPRVGQQRLEFGHQALGFLDRNIQAHQRVRGVPVWGGHPSVTSRVIADAPLDPWVLREGSQHSLHLSLVGRVVHSSTVAGEHQREVAQTGSQLLVEQPNALAALGAGIAKASGLEHFPHSRRKE